MAGNIKQLPVVIIAQIVGRYQKPQCAGLKTGKLVPIRIFICIKYIAAGGYRNRSIATDSYCTLVKSCSAANGKSGFRVLPQVGTGLRICSQHCKLDEQVVIKLSVQDS